MMHGVRSDVAAPLALRTAEADYDFELIDENGPAVTFGTPFQTEVAYWSVRDFVAQSKGPR
jgi:hypothetical protein